MAGDLVATLRNRATTYADNANYNRASYCAGRSGCDDISKIRNKPSDYLEWQAADEIERLQRELSKLKVPAP